MYAGVDLAAEFYSGFGAWWIILLWVDICLNEDITLLGTNQHIPSQDSFKIDVPFPNAFSVPGFWVMFQIVAIICSWNMWTEIRNIWGDISSRYSQGFISFGCRSGPKFPPSIAGLDLPPSVCGMTCCDVNVVQRHIIWQVRYPSHVWFGLYWSNGLLQTDAFAMWLPYYERSAK